ncbi:MAG: hypothetical protein KC983_08720 [Phycisphaerales bacterium]|nr:hypothetical protein [Phycisphaerales bacterium]
MQCNIDARGKAVRLVFGVVLICIAAGLAIAAGMNVLTGLWPWIAAGVIGAFGSFGIFEARAGWCAVRALGFQTPL